MAEITRRRTGEFLCELFKILMVSPGGLRGSDAPQTLVTPKRKHPRRRSAASD